MSPQGMNAQKRAAAFWQGLQPRERLGLVWAGALVAALAVWSLAVQPALRTLREAAMAVVVEWRGAEATGSAMIAAPPPLISMMSSSWSPLRISMLL